MKEGSKRCHRGYHLRGTSIKVNIEGKDMSEKLEGRKKKSSDKLEKLEEPPGNDNIRKMEDFLSGIVTLQIKKALQALVRGKEVQGRQEKKTGMEMLMDLLN